MSLCTEFLAGSKSFPRDIDDVEKNMETEGGFVMLWLSLSRDTEKLKMSHLG